MSKLQIECPGCGSSYELGSQYTQKLDKGKISCFVCHETIYSFEGVVAFYPFLKQRKENHLKLSSDDNLDNPSSLNQAS